ncbi:MAG TPA: hypothetical protein VGN17_13630 [Bryobacteraceae bacterium]|jgi:hypothetical protein
MQQKSYRLNAETLGIKDKYLRPTIVMIPEGSTVQIIDARIASRLIDVLWDGVNVAIFAQDLVERGVLQDEAEA